jgi:hypothetical protein
VPRSGRPRDRRRGAFPEGIDQEEALRRFRSFYGHPDEVIETLQKEKVLPIAKDLITQFNPAVSDHRDGLAAYRRFPRWR